MEYENTYVLQDVDDREVYAIVRTNLTYSEIEDIIAEAKEDSEGSWTIEDIIDALYDGIGMTGEIIEATDMNGVFYI